MFFFRVSEAKHQARAPYSRIGLTYRLNRISFVLVFNLDFCLIEDIEFLSAGVLFPVFDLCDVSK